jgi:putative addiction module component (TIGR02574 family)
MRRIQAGKQGMNSKWEPHSLSVGRYQRKVERNSEKQTRGLTMRTDALIDEIVSLPIEERARIAEALLQSLNPQDDATTAAWLIVANRRQNEVTSGQVQTIPEEQVFERIRQRHAR